MKTPITLLLAIAILVSCESSTSDDSTGKMKQKQEQREQRETKKTQRKVKDDDRVSGYFDIEIDGKSYKSTQLQDNYCDMTFLYKGEESFVTIRFKDVETNDAMLLTFYGDEKFIVDPSGKLESFMYSDAEAKANIQFIPGDGKGAMSSTTMLEGNIIVTKFEKGKIEATFEGKGGTPKNVITKENLVPFKGDIKLETKNVSEMGKDEEA